MGSPRKVPFAAPLSRRASLRAATTTLVVGALLATTSQAAEAAPTLAPSATESKPTAASQPVTERPDRVSAALSARLQNSRVLVSGETTESTLTFINPDGTITLEASSGPVRVKQGETWAPIDTTLVAADGVLKPKASLADVEFSAGGEGKPFARLERSGKQSYALTWPSPLPAPKIEGNKATYTNAAGPGADLVVTALPAGFRHDVVLRERPSGPVEFKIPVQNEGLTLAESRQGGLKLTDAKGKSVAVAAEPFMYDTPSPKLEQAAAETADSAPKRGTVDAQVVDDGDGQAVVLKPDAGFLADPATRYPVTVDPTVTLTAFGEWTVTEPNTGHGGLSVGRNFYVNPSTPPLERAVLNFNTSTLVGKAVTSARMELHHNSTDDYGCVVGQTVKVQRATSGTGTGAIWPGPTTTTSGEKLGQEPAPCASGVPNGWWTWDVTDIAKAWATGAPRNGFVLKLANEGASDDYLRTFNESSEGAATAPKLVVTLGSAPSISGTRTTPVAVTAGQTYANTTTPSLHAWVNDPEGSPVKVEYEVEKDPAAGSSGVLWTGSIDGVPAGSEAKITVPAGKLADGTKIRWRARAFDGTEYSAWSAWALATVDASPPAPPAFNAGDEFCPTEGSWSPIIEGTPSSCIVSTTGSDAYAFAWSWDDPNTNNLKYLGAGADKSATFTTPDTEGWHTLYVKVRDYAHNTSTVVTRSFGQGPGGLASPKDGSRTQRSVSLIGAGPADRSNVRYEYRKAGSDGTYSAVPPGDVTVPGTGQPLSAWPQTRTDTSKNFPELSWDVAKTLRAASIPDGAVELRACLSGGSAAEACTKPIKVTLDQSAFGGSYATTDVGPGKVALQTGDFSLSNTDAELFGISVNRTSTSLNPGADRGDEQLAENKVFGPGWRAAFPSVSSGIADFSPTSSGESGALQLVGADGSTLSYVKDGTSFTGVGDAADGSRVTTTAEQLTVTEATGRKTTYTKANSKWVVAHTETAAAESAITYYRDSAGRVTRILAPVSADITCDATLAPGCRALELSYAPTTTATGVASGWGDFKDQVKTVSFTAFDPESNAMKTTVLASYLYDSTGHLRQVTDPRTNLATVYYYTAEGRISQITPPGLAPWRMEYDTRGRLAHVQREGGDVDPTQAIAYDVPTGGSGVPIDLTAAQTATWGQATDLPVVGAGIFPASHVPARGSDGAYALAAGDWEYGSLIYTDVNGRAVNTAGYGAGAWQVSTARYDDKGNTVWELSPENRAQALTPTADTDPYVAGRIDSAERANLLATVSTYNADSDPLTVTDPARQVELADGKLVSARKLTTSTYDEGKPSSAIVYHLTTTTKAEPIVLDGTATPTTADARTVKTGYDPIKSGDTSGWDLRQTTSTTTVMPGQTDIVKKTRYDAAGREIERRQPASTGNDAGSTATAYYTAGAHPTVTACGNKPQWAGLACQRTPVAQPTGKPLPVTTMAYGYYGGATSSVETIGTTVRTTTTIYDTAGRPSKNKVEVTPANEGGTPVPETTITYHAATGLRASAASGTAALTNGYDAFGRLATTTDADGNTTTVGYTLDGQLASTADAKGSITYTYNGTDAVGRAERRGLPTAITAQRVGTFTAAYTGDGKLAVQGYPNGLIATNRYDSTGFHNSLAYAKGSTPWLVYQDTSDIHGKVVQSGDTQASNQRYTYDGAGRLTKTTDTADSSCTTRQYTLDANSNRKSLQTFQADANGGCSTSTTPVTKAGSFDAADRITNAGYVYDAFGRTTTVPAVDVTGGADLTVGYHANDMVASLSQSGTTKTYGLDPRGRIRTINTTTQGGSFGTIVNHYTGASDSPSWVSEADGSWTRNIAAFTGLTATERSDGSSQLKLTNLHGDVIASCDNTPNAGLSAYYGYSEYGQKKAGSSDPGRYGWLGLYRRSGGDTLGGLVFMGARLYNPTTGRFLQVDPILGGSDNPYEYAAQDPINNLDLDGTKKKAKKTKRPGVPGGPKDVTWGHCQKTWGGLGLECTGHIASKDVDEIVHDFKNGAYWANSCAVVASLGGAAAIPCAAVGNEFSRYADEIDYWNKKSNGKGVNYKCVKQPWPGGSGCEFSAA